MKPGKQAFNYLLTLITIIIVTTLSALAGGGGKDSFREGEIIVGLIPTANIADFNARYGTTTKEQMPGVNQFLLMLPAGVRVEDKLAQIEGDLNVLFAGPNFLFQSGEVRQKSQAFIDQKSQAFIDGQSPTNFYSQPSLPKLHLAEAHQFSRGQGVIVAVIDTGLDLNHSLFAGRIAYPVFDFVDNDGVPQDEAGGAGYGHGTFVSGLIALTAPGAGIMPLRAFGPDGFGTSFNIARAIRFATDNHAQVVNLSFGLLERDSLIDDALEYAYQRTYLVAAAGNDNLNIVHFPASRPSKTLCVTSVDASDHKASFANFDKDVMVSAPGVGIYSAYPGQRWATWSGTSFSTPLVSGEAALLLYLNPALNRSHINQTVTSAGVDIDSLNPGYAGKLGSVRIDFLAAVQNLKVQTSFRDVENRKSDGRRRDGASGRLVRLGL